MNTQAGEARSSVLPRVIPWLLFALGLCIVEIGGSLEGISASDLSRVGATALMMLVPINVVAYGICRFVPNRLLVSSCAGLVFVAACIVLLVRALP